MRILFKFSWMTFSCLLPLYVQFLIGKHCKQSHTGLGVYMETPHSTQTNSATFGKKLGLLNQVLQHLNYKD